MSGLFLHAAFFFWSDLLYAQSSSRGLDLLFSFALCVIDEDFRSTLHGKIFLVACINTDDSDSHAFRGDLASQVT